MNAPALLLEERAEQALASGAGLWVAYSGGRDSSALLHALSVRFPGSVRAVHVHHGLQDTADDWYRFCTARCHEWGVPLTALCVRVDTASATGIEAAARDARYAALSAALAPGDVLALAHHRRDQVETVLMRLFRGSGVAGLAAMQPWTARGRQWLWRPWLDTARSQIEDYAAGYGLHWIEDPHNRDPQFARTRLRHDILPQIRQSWPDAEAAVSRAARLCAEAQSLLDEQAECDAVQVGVSDTYPIAGALVLPARRRRNLLRWWLARQGVDAPSEDTLLRIERELIGAKPDARPVLKVGTQELRRYRDRMFLMPRLPAAPGDWCGDWAGARALRLPPGCGVLNLSPAHPRRAFKVRFPQGGERLQPLGASHTRTLKNLFQESATPPWIRERTPLLYRDGRLLAVADRWLDAGFAEELRSRGLWLLWRFEELDACFQVRGRASQKITI